MPALQEHEETLFLWAQDGRVEQISPGGEITQLLEAELEPVVTGPADDPRVSIIPPAAETAATWTSIIYIIDVPAGSQLQLNLYAAEEAAFRVRLLADGVEWETLLETAVAPREPWTDLTLPLDDYWQQTVILRLESRGNGLWGNPRLAINSP